MTEPAARQDDIQPSSLRPACAGRPSRGAARLSLWSVWLACLIGIPSGDARGAAFTITGLVTNQLGQGLANVDLDFIDTCSGDSAFLVNDKTIANGTFSVVVNQGTYDIHFTPPPGSTVTGSEIRGYTVAGNAAVGTTTLFAGRLVSGTVRNDSAVGVAGVDLKFVDVATGFKVWVGKDVTSASGTYAVRVRPGTYDVEYRPPAASTYAATRRLGLVVAASDVGGLVDVLPAGFRVDGTVEDPNHVAVKNADLNFYDDCTGEKISTANDNTDALGGYAIYVPAGTYSVHINPPACKNLASERIAGVRVRNATGIGTTRLSAGLSVTGRVLDDGGLPLPNAKLKFYRAATGARQAATRDDTDAAGSFSILVPQDTFNINVEPPSSRDLLVRRLSNVVVAGASALGDLALLPGQPLTGLVLGLGGAPVLNVNIDVVDSATRATVRIAHDSTHADGTFRVVVPPGTYDVQFSAPACTGLAPDDQKSVTVSGATALPTKALVAGVHVTGLVVDDATPIANPVAGADLDFVPAGSAAKSYTPGDTSDLAGAYDVLVKPGVYDIDYKPPAGSRLRPVRVSGVGAAANLSLPTVVMHPGWLLSGTAHAQATGLPVSGARINVFPCESSAAAWTPNNLTAADGSYVFSVDAGMWDLELVPPLESGLAPRWIRGVTVGADVALGDTLLLPLTLPSVSGVSPGSGSTQGGQGITISGAGFQPDARVLVGGVAAQSVSVVSSVSIGALTGPHPRGSVAVEVHNPGGEVGARASAYSYVEPPTPIVIRLARSGADVVLTWPATGQFNYTVFRSGAASAFSGASILGVTSGAGFTDAGGVGIGSVQFYNVD